MEIIEDIRAEIISELDRYFSHFKIYDLPKVADGLDSYLIKKLKFSFRKYSNELFGINYNNREYFMDSEGTLLYSINIGKTL